MILYDDIYVKTRKGDNYEKECKLTDDERQSGDLT